MSVTSGSLIIGSSNVCRLFDSGKFNHSRSYSAIKCTQALSFDAHMSSVGKDNKFVIISVIENFIADAVSNEREPGAEIVHCLNTFCNVVGDTAERLPETKFSIVTPLQRPVHKWYQKILTEITGKFEDSIKNMVVSRNLLNVNITKCSPISTQAYLDDGVHLTEASARIFLDHILSRSESYFDSEVMYVGEQAAESEEDRESVRDLERRLTNLEMAYKRQVEINFANNLVMARIREEIDSTGNRSKEDRVVITGLKSKDPIPADSRARIEWLKKIAMNLFTTIIPSFPGKIFYLSQGKQMDVLLPMVEIKLDKPENALAIRKAFAIKRKEKSLPAELESIFITNCVNLATRVRIEVLKALARKISTAEEIAYVSGFISRPMMHIKKAGSTGNSRPLRSFTFIDAVSRFSKVLTKEELTPSYERAGMAFKGQLEQTFVVLNEEDQNELQRLGTSKPWSGGPKGSAKGKGTPGGSSGTTAAGARGTKRHGSDLGPPKFTKSKK
jgi:hypothetical protein